MMLITDSLSNKYNKLPHLKKMLIGTIILFKICIVVILCTGPNENRRNDLKFFESRKIILQSNSTAVESIGKEEEDEVKREFQYAWEGYKKYAWGKDELLPIQQKGTHGFELGLTIIDGLDTAIVMGLKKESSEAINWIREHLDFDAHNDNVNLFETTIRVLGGLLSSYHLTKEPILLKKAEELGDRLLCAFQQSKSAVPRSDVNLKSRIASNPSGFATLAEVTTIQLEFRDLSRLTGNMIYEQYAMNVSLHIHEIGCDGLCSFSLNVDTGEFRPTTRTLGARADSFYEYLLKQYLQTNVLWFREDWNKYIDIIEQTVYKRMINNDVILGEVDENKKFVAKMDHLACFLSGSLALSYMNKINRKHLEMAENIAETCYKMYTSTPTGLAAEIYKWDDEKGMRCDFNDRHSLLRPEAVESFFYLYRATKNEKYREWSWTIFKTIQKYAKVPSGGYSSIKNVYQTINTARIDKMESFFLAETLKYIYLTVAKDQTILPLDEWIFNTEAHPLPLLK